MLEMSPAILFSGMLIATVGLGLFIYGKKQQDIPALAAGIVLSVIPFFMTSLLALWLTTLGIFAGMWARNRFAG